MARRPKARDRDRRPGRPPASLEPKRLILVFTEGRKTEKEYLLGFAKAFRNPLVEVRVARDHRAPFELVEAAKDA